MTSIRPHSSYRHEAFLYRGEDDFLTGTVPFVCDGVAAGQPVMVAIRGSRLPALRSALGPVADDVLFVDMTELGHNPARIIPGWRRFLAERCVDDRPVRGVGEPIWAGRRPAEVSEAQLHEALLNVAVEPDTPLWLRCPYDLDSLTEADLDEAARSHPILVEAGVLRGSCSYGGMQHVEDLFAADLAEPDQPTEGIALPAAPAEVAALVGRHAEAAGLDAERATSLSLAVRELTAAAIAGCRLRIWIEPGALVCELRDPDPVDDPLAGRVQPADDEPDERGLWQANQTCDLVQVRSTPDGSTVRVISWL
jgi:MEDS: MEthanogen/methylotroph, DcmR Sensory domain/Histidine kinase-like ATPase domain